MIHLRLTTFTGAAGVYVLYHDGDDVRLLTRLYEQEVSDFDKVTQANMGVYKTGDNVMIAGHNLQIRDTFSLGIFEIFHSIFKGTMPLRLLQCNANTSSCIWHLKRLY